MRQHKCNNKEKVGDIMKQEQIYCGTCQKPVKISYETKDLLALPKKVLEQVKQHSCNC